MEITTPKGTLERESIEAILEQYGRDCLRNADLRGFDLSHADLTKAEMMGGDLRSADVGGADLADADLHGAEGAGLIMAQTRILPDDGDIIGWKKARTVDNQPIIVKLLIPSDAQRSNAMGRQCRASEARVLDLQDLAGHSIATVAYSARDPEFAYRLGETVESDGFNPDRWVECTDGIHFFITRIEAVEY